jgi:hypothetical protein
MRFGFQLSWKETPPFSYELPLSDDTPMMIVEYQGIRKGRVVSQIFST